MKMKLLTLIFGAIFSLQVIFPLNVNVYAENYSIAVDDRVVQVEFGSSAEPTEIELAEGEQVQLDFQLDSNEYYLDDISSYSKEGNAVVLHNGKLVGCYAGADCISIGVRNRLTNKEDIFYIKVVIAQNENISAENRAELNRLKEFQYDDYRRRKLELLGAIDENAPRLDMEKVLEIIDISNSYDEILIQFNNYHDCPDIIAESGNTAHVYWFDSKGNESITYILESDAIAYTKIAEDGTVVGVQQLYPEKSEFIENGKDKSYNYIQYNQIPPEGYGTAEMRIIDRDTGELISDETKDFQLIAKPLDESSTEEPKIIETWNPSESNPHIISDLSKEYQYEIQYLGAKEGDYWYEIDESSQTYSFGFSYSDEYTAFVYMKKHYPNEPQLIREGDVNVDGEFNVTDVVTFQKWLCGSSDTQLVEWVVADFCEDGVLNVFDLALMKKELLN